MDKTATVRVLTMVAQGLDNGMSKEAGWWDNLKQWTKDKIEDPTGVRRRSRRNRALVLEMMQDNASNYTKPAFSNMHLFATPFAQKQAEKQHDRATSNYNEKMVGLYTNATVARGNKPYRMDRNRNWNYTPAPGVEYK